MLSSGNNPRISRIVIRLEHRVLLIHSGNLRPQRFRVLATAVLAMESKNLVNGRGDFSTRRTLRLIGGTSIRASLDSFATFFSVIAFPALALFFFPTLRERRFSPFFFEPVLVGASLRKRASFVRWDRPVESGLGSNTRRSCYGTLNCNEYGVSCKER